MKKKNSFSWKRALVVVGCLLPLLTSCGDDLAASTPVKPQTVAPKMIVPTTTAPKTVAPTMVMPDLSLARLDSALDKLHQLGVYLVAPDDLTSLNRTVTSYTTWEVCTQEPTAGIVITKSTEVTLRVAMVGEQCADPEPSPSEEPVTAAAEPAQEPAQPEPQPVVQPPAQPPAPQAIATTAPEPAPAPAPPPPAPAPARDVYYKNCTEARAAGAAPIRRGEPGYRPQLDRDDDGIACE